MEFRRSHELPFPTAVVFCKGCNAKTSTSTRRRDNQREDAVTQAYLEFARPDHLLDYCPKALQGGGR